MGTLEAEIELKGAGGKPAAVKIMTCETIMVNGDFTKEAGNYGHNYEPEIMAREKTAKEERKEEPLLRIHNLAHVTFQKLSIRKVCALN